MTKRYSICGDDFLDASLNAEYLGLADDEWNWCSDCADKAFRNYPEEEEEEEE